MSLRLAQGVLVVLHPALPHLALSRGLQWSARYPGRVIEWPTNVHSRIAPAVDRAFAAVMEGTLTHDGNRDLARHVGNCTVKATPHGAAVVKGSKSQKIDASVAGLVAFDRAAWRQQHPARRRRVASF